MPEKPPFVLPDPTALNSKDSLGSHANALFWMEWKRHVDFLQQLCLRWMGDEDDARDALSGAMLRAWEGLEGRIHEIGNLRAWLTTATKHHCIDLLRARNHSPIHLTDAAGLESLAETEPFMQEGDVETGHIWDENIHLVLERLEALPNRLREVLEMRACLGLGYGEISSRLQISPANARKRVQDARRLLKSMVEFGAPQVRRQPDRPADDGGSRHDFRGLPSEILPPQPLAAIPPHAIVLPATDTQNTYIVFRAHKQQRIPQRLQTLDKYLLRHPGGWVKRQERAELWLMEGKMEAAFLELSSLLGTHKNLHPLRLRVAGLGIALGIPLPQNFWEDANLHSTHQAQTAHVLALQCLSKGELSQALGHLRPSLPIGEESVESMHCSLHVLWAAQAHEELEVVAKAWLQRHPMDRLAHFMLSCMPFSPGKSLAYLNLAIPLFPREALVKAQWLRVALASGMDKELGRLPASLPYSLVLDLKLVLAAQKGRVEEVANLLQKGKLEGNSRSAWMNWLENPENTPLPEPVWVHWLPLCPF